MFGAVPEKGDDGSVCVGDMIMGGRGNVIWGLLLLADARPFRCGQITHGV